MSLYNGKLRNFANTLLQALFCLSSLSLLCRLGHTAGVPFYQCQEKCHSAICGDEALRITKLMNEQVDPCENFYEFACGNYIKNTPLNDSQSAVSNIINAQKDIVVGMLSVLSEGVKDSDLEAFKKIKIYYQNCLNETRTEEAGTGPLMEILDSIGGWPVLLRDEWDARRFDLMRSTSKIKENRIAEFFPVVVTVEIDNLDSKKYSINLKNADNDVDASWFSGDHRSEATESLSDSILNAALVLGARNDSTTLREIQQIIDFQVALYNISTPAEKLFDLPVEKSRTSIRELSSKYPSIPWLELINKILNPSGVFVNESEVVYVADPSFISGVVNVIERTPKRVLANYFAWKTVQRIQPYMPKILSDDGNAPEGSQDPKAKCYLEVQNMFPIGMSAIFVRKHFKASIQAPISEMFENIRRQTRKILQENDWMDEKTRQAALEKLDAMRVTIGYAEELMDDKKVNEFYQDLEINPGSFLESALNVSFFLEKNLNKKLRKATNEDEWASKQSVVELNAYNVIQSNTIELPAGFLKSFYKQGRPEYINYGSLAIFIGHEVFHGFDNEGRQYDKHGNQVNWWQPSTEQQFKRRTQCIVDQYSNYTVEEINLKVNGELSQGENIADNGGFRTAYLAYLDWAKHNNPEGCLPSLNYTARQMFWISAASIWCSKSQPEKLRELVTTDPHSPDEARVIIPLSNTKEFADDFKCNVGSRMNPQRKCKIW